MVNLVTEKRFLVSFVIASILLMIAGYHSHLITQSIYASKSTSDETTNTASARESAANGDNSSIVMNALELNNGTYRWENASHGINPTIHLVAGTGYNIKINNPTDSKHELIIGTNGTEIAGSKSVKAGKNTEFVFNSNASGVLEYHCEYHPDTMKGTIEITSQ